MEDGLKPGPNCPVYRFGGTLGSAEAVVDVKAASAGRVEWVEVFVEGRA
jgi:hypothetical protein